MFLSRYSCEYHCIFSYFDNLISVFNALFIRGFFKETIAAGPKTLDFYQVIAFKCSSLEGSVTTFMKLKPWQLFSSLVLIGH